MRAPLVLTGGPAVGKSTTAGLLACRSDRAAAIEVDDVRQLIVSGHAAPWQGPEGIAQQRLGVRNACALAVNFRAEQYDVVLTDVLTPATARLYRQLLPGCLIVRLYLTAAEASRRAAGRPVHLTDAEFADLHSRDRDDTPPADHHLDVTELDIDEQAAAVAALWNAAPGSTTGRQPGR